MIELIKTILLSALPQLPFKNSIPKGVSVYPNKVNTQREKKIQKINISKAHIKQSGSKHFGNRTHLLN